MKRVVGTFVARQQHLQYPLGIISEPYKDFDKIYWLVGSTDDIDALENTWFVHPLKDKIEIVNLDQELHDPGDIGVAQTRSVKYMQEQGADIVGYQQADLCLTEAGMGVVNARLEDATPTTAFSIMAIQSKLYCETYRTPHCCFFIGSDIEHDWPGGWNNRWRVPGGTWHHFPPAKGPKRMMVDLGYLDTASYHRKAVHHQALWGKHHRLVEMSELFEADTKAAVFRGLEYLSNEMKGVEGFMPHAVGYYTPYREIINKLGVYEDYCLVRDVMMTYRKKVE